MTKNTQTYELTPEQVEIIEIAVEFWAQDQYMMEDDMDEEDLIIWQAQQEVLDNDFPF
jgi:hypothetical protein